MVGNVQVMKTSFEMAFSVDVTWISHHNHFNSSCIFGRLLCFTYMACQTTHSRLTNMNSISPFSIRFIDNSILIWLNSIFRINKNIPRNLPRIFSNIFFYFFIVKNSRVHFNSSRSQILVLFTDKEPIIHAI